MSRFLSPASVLVLAVLLLASCSGGASWPTAPGLQGDGNGQARTASNVHLWGLWEVTLDPAAETAELVPLRDAQFTCNVTQFLQPPAATKHLMSIYIDPSSDFVTGDLVVDVTLTHPFPGLDTYTGFDVRGVCIGNGSISGIIDTLIRYGGPDDLRVVNPDGLTRWFNPREFTKYDTLFGYTRGKLGTPSDDWTATLNGYKYFCQELDKEDGLAEFFANPSCPNPRGYFASGSSLTRRYQLKFPSVGGSPAYRFQYGVIASWQDPVNKPPTDIPGDFPIEANCPEAFTASTADQSDMYYVDPSTKGGSLELVLRVLDHQGAGTISGVHPEIAAVHLETPHGLITGGSASFDSAALDAALLSEDGISATYLLQVPSVDPYASGDFPVLVVIENSDPDSYDPGLPGFPYPTSARLAAYLMATVHVLEELPFADPVAIAEITTPIESYYYGDHIVFDGSQSYDPDNDPPATDGIVQFEWDWDNDGTYEELWTEPEAKHTWLTPGTYYVQLRVTDDEGATDTLDEPMEIEILPIHEPQLIATLTQFHSPFCSKVDTQENEAWVDCTQAAPVLDFGFYRIDNDENVEKGFEKSGSGFFGMPGWFGLSVEARKIIAPDMLSMGALPVDIWDLDGGDALKFWVPADPGSMLFFAGDADLFQDLSVAMVTDVITQPQGRLISWDYSEASPTYDVHNTGEYPNLIEADYENHRLFVYCRDTTGGSGPTVEIWDAETWTKTDEFATDIGEYPFMADIDYDPDFERLYLPGGTSGAWEAWDSEDYSHIQSVYASMGEVAGIDHMGGGIYVTVPGHLLVYDFQTFTLLWNVSCGPDPRIVSCNPNTHKIYIPDMNASAVYVYEL
jgi:PKD repeat protein